ncbi:2-polyprenyl-6-methoxyphenol hydroxylase-like FAD-dependent oxidoreductase [Spinactinospora alkalitolerans]|uniref:2-polyprenyl-6-methoxyphenol hydroxylase-like FAD-dependent oxidoreductase n=1 Tax=Spinactinospora alkalitolerans TaxID=687207 RepID=A0A852TXQ6_9ACTN|nr:styrene monooxygenase/indole monooxygenase family protein [Spinactinospora alkalitolerans]NYE48135.1 2-polyprenyl-6-methoxyphenol hydroxylase-like FAD-dependent oxidoreductase [Spinactinospora alkalitolerans]
MRKILIVGAGQSGLHLAHSLLSHGYDVTLITGQTSTEIRTGRPSIAQLTFPTVLEYEREQHLDFWSAAAPQIEKFKIHLYPSGEPPLVLQGRTGGEGRYTQSVDRRVKIADWLEYFEDRGGKVVIHGVTVTDLDYFSRMFDLIVVAVGHGELGALFDSDTSRFSGARGRVIAQANVYDVAADPVEDEDIGWAASAADGGNIIFPPVLTPQGPCHSLVMVEKRGGPMDAWPEKLKPEDQLHRMKELLRAYAPDYYERCKDALLVDGRSTLRERLIPQVRNPVGVLPSGGLVLGIADVVITMDPFSGQGWNNSTRCAMSYLGGILERGDRPFDREFLEGMFERFWEYGHPVQLWAEALSTMWDTGLPDHFQEVLAGALEYAEVGDRWIQGWDYPPDYANWLFDPALAREYLAKVRASHGS